MVYPFKGEHGDTWCDAHLATLQFPSYITESIIQGSIAVRLVGLEAQATIFGTANRVEELPRSLRTSLKFQYVPWSKLPKNWG